MNKNIKSSRVILWKDFQRKLEILNLEKVYKQWLQVHCQKVIIISVIIGVGDGCLESLVKLYECLDLQHTGEYWLWQTNIPISTSTET